MKISNRTSTNIYKTSSFLSCLPTSTCKYRFIRAKICTTDMHLFCLCNYIEMLLWIWLEMIASITTICKIRQESISISSLGSVHQEITLRPWWPGSEPDLQVHKGGNIFWKGFLNQKGRKMKKKSSDYAQLKCQSWGVIAPSNGI